MENLNSFTALDFETMTGKRSSACAIGMIKVADERIVDKYYSLIKPIPDDSKTLNTWKNKISPEMVADKPTFDMLWPEIKAFIGDDVIVCHNVSFDKSVLAAQLDYYNLSFSPTFVCTYKLTGLSLDDACLKYRVGLTNHHHALHDAMACAQVLLAVREIRKTDPSQVSPLEYEGVERNSKSRGKSKSTSKSKSLPKLDDSLIKNKNTIFYKKTVVYTGNFTIYAREELGLKLQSLGAKVNADISGKTEIIIFGSAPGPAKREKAEQLVDEGKAIIIYENDLAKYLTEYVPSDTSENLPVEAVETPPCEGIQEESVEDIQDTDDSAINETDEPDIEDIQDTDDSTINETDEADIEDIQDADDSATDENYVIEIENTYNIDYSDISEDEDEDGDEQRTPAAHDRSQLDAIIARREKIRRINLLYIFGLLTIAIFIFVLCAVNGEVIGGLILGIAAFAVLIYLSFK